MNSTAAVLGAETQTCQSVAGLYHHEVLAFGRFEFHVGRSRYEQHFCTLGSVLMRLPANHHFVSSHFRHIEIERALAFLSVE